MRCNATLKSEVMRIYTLSGCHLTSLHQAVSLNVIAARDTTRTLPTSLHGDGEVQQKWRWAAEKEQIGGWWCSTCSRAGRETRRRARRSPGLSSSSPASSGTWHFQESRLAASDNRDSPPWSCCTTTATSRPSTSATTTEVLAPRQECCHYHSCHCSTALSCGRVAFCQLSWDFWLIRSPPVTQKSN